MTTTSSALTLPRTDLHSCTAEGKFCAEGATARVVAVSLPPKEGSCHDESVVAWKVVGPSFTDASRNEVDILTSLSPHPHVIQLRRSFTCPDDGTTVLELELAEGGDLEQAMSRSRSKPSAGVIKAVLTQLLEALVHLHAHGVVHNDVKSENVLLRRQCSSFDQITDVANVDTILCDLGTAMNAACGVHNDRDAEDVDSSLARPHAGRGGGTRCTAAPESLPGCSRYVTPTMPGDDRPRDLWAVGLVAFHLLTGCRLFTAEEGDDTPEEQIRDFVMIDARRQRLLARVADPEARAFVASLLVADPSKRPTATEALTHTWLVDGA